MNATSARRPRMMVGTRSGARPPTRVEAKAPSPPIPRDIYDIQSSDDDEEDIPFTSPRKPMAIPKSTSLDHRRDRSHESDRNRSMSSSQFKKRKIEHGADFRDAPPYPTPVSSTATIPAAAINQDERTSYSPDDAVPAGLINSLNAALKQHDHEEPQKHPESPTPQLSRTKTGDDKDSQADQIDLNHEDVTPQELEGDQGSLFVPDNESEVSSVQDSTLDVEDDRDVQNNPTAGQDPISIWEVPSSPHHPSSSETQEDEDENALKHIKELYSDDENLSDIDLSAEESFAQDVTNFRARHPGGYEGTDTFDNPPDNDDIAISIQFAYLQKALKLMRQRAWAGLKSGWYARPFDCEQLETGPIRALVEFLAKFERLLENAPKAPHIARQNVFFCEHGSLVGYYFSKIKLILHHIRERRQASLSRLINTKKCDIMQEELISHAIPMLFHVMASVWCLGGDNPHRPSFTASSIQLLVRVLSWVELLYHPIFGELQQEQLVPNDSVAKYRRDELVMKRTKREELKGYLEGLRRVLEGSIDDLEREDNRRKQEQQNRQRDLELQKEIKAQRGREEEEKRRLIEEKQQRSLMSLRGIHVPLSQPLMSSPSKGSSKVQVSPPPQSIDNWPMEEKRLLFREIQKSYPTLPNLVGLSSDLDRTLGEVESATKEILELMLETVCPEDDAADRAAHIQRMMDEYKVSYGH